MKGKKYLVIMIFDICAALPQAFIYKVEGNWWNLILAVLLAICALGMYNLWHRENYIELPDWAKPYFEDR